MVVHFPSEDTRKAAHHDAKRLFDEHRDARSVHEALEPTHGHRAASDAIHRFDEQHVGYKREDLDHNNNVLSVKETLERLAFGVGNLQLLNVLLITVIPNFLLAGILLGIRSIISGLVESGYGVFAGPFENETKRSFAYGSALGYSFILASIFITLASIGDGIGHVVFTSLFAISFLAIGVFGALYLQSGLRLKTGSINKDRMRHYLKWLSYYGIVLVAVVFLAAGIVLDRFAEPIVFDIGGLPLTLPGYAMLLFATGILVLITSYLATRLRRIRTLESGVGSMSSYAASVRASLSATLGQGAFVRSMLIAGVLFYSVQLALNYYLGIHLYTHFNETFTPVAVLFAATLLTMFTVPLFFDRTTLKLNGRSSLFMFGAGLTVFIPISFALVNIPSVRAMLISALSAGALAETAVDFFPMMYLLIGIAGSSIAGIAFSRLALDTMKPQARSQFMRSLGLLTPIVSGVLIITAFSLRYATGSPIASFSLLALALLVAIIIFASLIAGRLEERFEQQAFAPHKV